MSLTKHQNDIMTQILQAVEQGHRRIVLKGSAGVGKTFMVNELVRRLVDKRRYVYLTAPTNKALAVLREKITVQGLMIFSTVHSALKLKRRFKSNGDVYFNQEYSDRYPPFQNCKILIIDESSMISEEILGYLQKYDFPIIFVGDDKQLNPINENDSPIFTQHWLTFELKEIIRQRDGNPIIDLSRDIPRIWTDGQPNVNSDTQGYLYTSDRQKIIDKLAEANGTDKLKYLAYTNNEVDIMNMSVRAKIYGDKPSMIEKGETLVLNAPYGDNFYTNQEVKVEGLKVGYTDIKTPLGMVRLKAYLLNDEIKIVHEESLTDFKNISKNLKQRCKIGEFQWKEYYNFLENFADFKYNHAITVHKSQGSTYKDVILNVGNLNLNRNKAEKQRLFYTGITRASNLLILYNV